MHESNKEVEIKEHSLFDSKDRPPITDSELPPITVINDKIVEDLIALDSKKRKEQYQGRFTRCENYTNYRSELSEGQTRGLLHFAVEKQDPELVDFLIENCPKERIKSFLESTCVYFVELFDCTMKYCTPLQLATYLGAFEIMEKLLASGANPNCFADEGEEDENMEQMPSITPLELLSKKSEDAVPMLQLLNRYSADFSLPPMLYKKEFALGDAIRWNKAGSLDFLLNEVQVTAKDKIGEVKEAPYISNLIRNFSNHPKLCQFIDDLIRQGADITQVDERDELALHIAIRKLSIEQIRFLIEKYPRALWISNNGSETAFSLLAKRDVELAEEFYKKYPPAICYILDFDGTLTNLAGDSAFIQYGKTLGEQIASFQYNRLLPGAKELLEKLMTVGDVFINSNNYAEAIKAALKTAKLTDAQIDKLKVLGRNEEPNKFARLVTLLQSPRYDWFIAVDDDYKMIVDIQKLKNPKCGTMYEEWGQFKWDSTSRKKILELSQPVIKYARRTFMPVDVTEQKLKSPTTLSNAGIVERSSPLGGAGFFQPPPIRKGPTSPKIPISDSKDFLGNDDLYYTHYLFHLAEAEVGMKQEKDLSKAIQLYSFAAAKEFDLAQFKLATLLEAGQGVEKNIDEALLNYTKAAKQNNNQAQLRLARIYREGVLVDRNVDKAFDWYWSASGENPQAQQEFIEFRKETLHALTLKAEAGDPDAQFTLADYYRFGLRAREEVIMEADDDKVVHYLELAAKQEHIQAQVMLAEHYYPPFGMLVGGEVVDSGNSENIKKAAHWYQLAADKGDQTAQVRLARFYLKGLGVSQDFKRAGSLYRAGAEQGNTLAQYELGCLYETGVGVAKDNKEAIKWFHLAAMDENKAAQMSLARCLENNSDLKEAVKWYQKAAKNGMPEAQTKLALMCREGRVVPKNMPYAIKLFRLAAESGDAEAAYCLSQHLYQGLGITKDVGEARRWLEAAADRGYGIAKVELGKLLEKEGAALLRRAAQNYSTALLPTQSGFIQQRLLLLQQTLNLLTTNPEQSTLEPSTIPEKTKLSKRKRDEEKEAKKKLKLTDSNVEDLESIKTKPFGLS